ncbi:hypothetical protein TYRP_019843 [Tyrophagus putrescentiae]|nr:hypothetical protein TYRP_019843 [Tyrophagus putrescentiae]
MNSFRPLLTTICEKVSRPRRAPQTDSPTIWAPWSQLGSAAMMVKFFELITRKHAPLKGGNARRLVEATAGAAGPLQVEVPLDAPLLSPAILDDPVLLRPADQERAVVGLITSAAAIEGAPQVLQLRRRTVPHDDGGAVGEDRRRQLLVGEHRPEEAGAGGAADHRKAGLIGAAGQLLGDIGRPPAVHQAELPGAVADCRRLGKLFRAEPPKVQVPVNAPEGAPAILVDEVLWRPADGQHGVGRQVVVGAVAVPGAAQQLKVPVAAVDAGEGGPQLAYQLHPVLVVAAHRYAVAVTEGAGHHGQRPVLRTGLLLIGVRQAPPVRQAVLVAGANHVEGAVPGTVVGGAAAAVDAVEQRLLAESGLVEADVGRAPHEGRFHGGGS